MPAPKTVILPWGYHLFIIIKKQKSPSSPNNCHRGTGRWPHVQYLGPSGACFCLANRRVGAVRKCKEHISLSRPKPRSWAGDATPWTGPPWGPWRLDTCSGLCRMTERHTNQAEDGRAAPAATICLSRWLIWRRGTLDSTDLELFSVRWYKYFLLKKKLFQTG